MCRNHRSGREQHYVTKDSLGGRKDNRIEIRWINHGRKGLIRGRKQSHKYKKIRFIKIHGLKNGIYRGVIGNMSLHI